MPISRETTFDRRLFGKPGIYGNLLFKLVLGRRDKVFLKIVSPKEKEEKWGEEGNEGEGG